MGKEVKAFPFEMKLNEKKRTIEGYASTFGNRDLVGDVVEAGAFRKTINERANQIKLLWQHYEPLGKPLRMSEDSKGLHVEAYISKTTLGNDALELVRDGVIDRMSIGYDVVKDEYKSDTNTRHLKELKLYEFSLVTFPANEEAAVTGVKQMENLQQILQKAGAADVTRLLKEGRKLSRANEELIKNAIEALEAVLELGEPDDDEGEKSTRKDSSKPLENNIYLPELDEKAIAELVGNFKI